MDSKLLEKILLMALAPWSSYLSIPSIHTYILRCRGYFVMGRMKLLIKAETDRAKKELNSILQGLCHWLCWVLGVRHHNRRNYDSSETSLLPNYRNESIYTCHATVTNSWLLGSSFFQIMHKFNRWWKDFLQCGLAIPPYHPRYNEIKDEPLIRYRPIVISMRETWELVDFSIERKPMNGGRPSIQLVVSTYPLLKVSAVYGEWASSFARVRNRFKYPSRPGDINSFLAVASILVLVLANLSSRQ